MTVQEKERDETANFITSTDDSPIASTPEDVQEPEQDNEESEKEEFADSIEVERSENEEPEAKSQGGINKKIGKLTKQREEARRESEALKRRIAELEAKQPAKEPKVTEINESDFENYDDYLDAVDKQEQEKTQKPEEKPEVEDAKKEESKTDEYKESDEDKTAKAILFEKVEASTEDYKDFEKVAYSEDVTITSQMMRTISKADDPKKVLYYLGKNPDVSKDISKMDSDEAGFALLNIDKNVKIKPDAPVKNTKASEPISPVRASDSQEKPLSKMTFAEFAAKRDKEERELYKRRS